MPITPLHLGILAPINHLLPGKVNNLSFWLVTLWLDASAIAYYAFDLEMGEFHGPETHSFIAAAALAGLVGMLGLGYYVFKELFWSALQENSERTLAWLCGAYLAGFSHILLDAMVHSEMLPFAPIPGNPFYWGGMEPISLLLLPFTIWLTSQYALSGVHQARKSLAAARLKRH